MKYYFIILLLPLFIAVDTHAQQPGYESLSTDSLTNLAYYLSGNNLDSSLSSAQALASRYESDNDTLAGVYGYSLLGFAHYYKDQYFDGINAYLKSNEIISQDSSYYFLKVENHVGLSSLYSLLGNYSSAVDQLLKAQESISEEFEAQDKALLYQTMAEVFYDIGEYNTSLKYAKRVNSLLKQQYGDEAEKMSTVNTLIAEIYADRGKLDSAESLANAELRYAKEERQPIAEIYSLEALAAVYYKRGRLDTAIALQTAAYEIAREFDDQFTLALEAADLGYYHYRANNIETSERYANEALKITESFPPNLARKEALELAYKVAEANNNFPVALEYFKEFSTIEQQMAGADISEELIKSRYLVSEKERNLLSLKSEMQQEQIAAQNKLNLLISTITILLVVAVIAVLLAFRNSRKFNRKLSHKQKILNAQRLELRELNEELEANGKNKDKLLSILSHDVRQPFNQTISLLEILEHSKMPEPGMDEMVKSIKQSVRDHKNSIENLLTWSKSQLNGITRHPDDVNIEEMVNEVSLSLSSLLKDKDLNLKTDIAPSITAFADPDQLEIILKNLLGNAIKFSYSGHEVKISSYSRQGYTYIEIADQGIGMDEDSQLKLLDRKQQFSNKGTSDEVGSGFGTLIVLDFIEQNKGKLKLESKLGDGSVFTVCLPASSPNKKAPLQLEEALV